MVYRFNIRKRIRCKGVLNKEMTKRVTTIAAVSIFSYLLPLSVLFIVSPNDSIVGKICGFLIFWYLTSLIMIKVSSTIEGKFEFRDWVITTIYFPLFFSLFTTAYIFKMILKRKYPEMEEEHYERWVKIQRLKNKIR